MPYAQDFIGIYSITNTITKQCYVGQSQRVKKRVSEHFRLLRLGQHGNQRLQHSFNKYGESAFKWNLEIECENLLDIDIIEEMYIKNDAQFEFTSSFNIAGFAKAPMRGKQHTPETKAKIRETIKLQDDYRRTPSFIAKSEAGRLKARLENPEFVNRIKYIIENDHLSYAERGRNMGKCASSVRKLYLNYCHLKGEI